MVLPEMHYKDTRTVCPSCGGTYFGSAIEVDGVPQRQCLTPGCGFSLDDQEEFAHQFVSAAEVLVLVETLRDGLAAALELMNNSEGVAGLHLNGDLATWGELREGGAFESWLLDFDDAVEAGNIREARPEEGDAEAP